MRRLLHTVTDRQQLPCGCLVYPQSLASLRALDVGGNQLRRVEALAACRGLSLMSSLNIAGNPVEAAQNVRHHVVHLLTQVRLPQMHSARAVHQHQACAAPAASRVPGTQKYLCEHRVCLC